MLKAWHGSGSEYAVVRDVDTVAGVVVVGSLRLERRRHVHVLREREASFLGDRVEPSLLKKGPGGVIGLRRGQSVVAAGVRPRSGS